MRPTRRAYSSGICSASVNSSTLLSAYKKAVKRARTIANATSSDTGRQYGGLSGGLSIRNRRHDGNGEASIHRLDRCSFVQVAPRLRRWRPKEPGVAQLLD